MSQDMTTNNSNSNSNIPSANAMAPLPCVACGKMYEEWGWEGLCNRQCYHVMRDLHYKFEKAIEEGKSVEPDPRVVKYFTLYPYRDIHAFYNYGEHILSYIHYKKTGFHILW